MGFNSRTKILPETVFAMGSQELHKFSFQTQENEIAKLNTKCHNFGPEKIRKIRHQKNQKKTNEPFLRKMPKRQTDRRTDRQTTMILWGPPQVGDLI